MNHILICGLPGSGKTTTLNFLKEISSSLPIEVGTSVDTLPPISDKTQILLIQCPVILCFQRTRRADQCFEEFLKTNHVEYKEKLMRYMTELPNCTIIKNDLSLEHLRLQIKKFLKK